LFGQGTGDLDGVVESFRLEEAKEIEDANIAFCRGTVLGYTLLLSEQEEIGERDVGMDSDHG
jgi:hypothetical protein